MKDWKGNTNFGKPLVKDIKVEEAPILGCF